MLRALLNTFLSTMGFAACLLVPAQAFTWGRAWALIVVFAVIHIVGTIRLARASPDLLRDRARLRPQRGQPIMDKVLRLAFMMTYAGMLVVSAMDAWRWHVCPAQAARA